MKAYWDSLQDRERWALLIAAVFCTVLLLYGLIFSPLTHIVERRSMELTEKRETLAWMKQMQQEHPNFSQALTTTPKGNYLTLISNQLKSSAFRQYPYQFQQTARGDLELSFEEVPYNEFMQWLSTLSLKYPCTIELLNVDKTDIAGVVRLRAVLRV